MFKRRIVFIVFLFSILALFVRFFSFETLEVSNKKSITETSALVKQTRQYSVSEGERSVSPILASPSIERQEAVINESLAPAFAQIAQQFEKVIQYPSFSLPIFEAKSVEKYKPNQSVEMVYQKDGMWMSLSTDALMFRPDEPITGRILLNNVPSSSVHIRLVQNGQVIASQFLEVAEDISSFTFEPLGQAWRATQIFVIASVDMSGETRTVSAPILRFNTAQVSVELIGFEESFVQGPWLKIPAILTVANKGYYRLEANLYSQTQRPLIHLSAEKLLVEGQHELTLQAHIQALKVMGDEGDYQLADFDLAQMPAPPNYETKPGNLLVRAVKVRGYRFSSYDDEPWEDSDAKERLVFLNEFSQ